VLRKTVLDNGLAVLNENVPGTSVCGTGLWLRRGSSAENGWPLGITHLYEHMNFKGTRTRTARDLSTSIEGRGGSINASTGRSSTYFYTNSLVEDWAFCLEILADMVLNSRYDAAELEKEKSVILDEIRMVEELPDEELYDLGFRDMFPDSPHGHPVQGTAEQVRGVDRETLLRYAADCTTGTQLVLAQAGDVDHVKFVAAVERLFGHLPPGEAVEPLPVPEVPAGRHDHPRPAARQAHLQLGAGTPPFGGREYDALALLSTLLGEGMSSRLFQELREQRALCYNVYSWMEGIGGGGAAGCYMACDTDRADEALDACRAQFCDLAEHGPREDELDRTLRQVRGGLMIGLEQNINRMVRLARSELTLGRPVSVEEKLERLESLSLDELGAVARRWLDPERFCVSRILPGKSS